MLPALAGESEDCRAPFNFDKFFVQEMQYVQAGIYIPVPNPALTLALSDFAASYRMHRVPRLPKHRLQLQFAAAAEL